MRGARGKTWSLTLLAPAGEKDGEGLPVERFVEDLTLDVRKEDLSDRARQLAQQSGVVITTRFQVEDFDRTRAVTDQWRALCNGRVYAIRGVKEIDGRDELEFTAEALLRERWP